MLNPKTVAEAQAAGWKHLNVKCTQCGHQAEVPWASVSNVGWLDRMSNRLKCSVCGAKQPTCWPYMDPRDLKRLQQMVRN